MFFFKFRRVSKFKKLWPYVRPHTGTMIVASLFSIPMAALGVIPVWALKYLTDEVLQKKNADALRFLVIAIPAGFLANFICRFMNNYLMRSSAQKMIEELRNDLYRHILRLSVSYFNEAQGGVLVSRVTNDIQVIVRAVSSVVDLIKEPLTFIGLLGYAFYLNWKLTIFTLIMVPTCGFLMANASRHTKRYSGRILDNMGAMSSLLAESVSGIRVIQAFNLEKYLRGQFHKVNHDLTLTQNKAIRVEELSRPAVEFIFGVVLTILMYFAGREALKGWMSPGDVIAFFTSFGIMLQPLRKISELNVSLSHSAAAIDSVFDILATVPAVEDRPAAKVAQPFAREIEFKNVTFRYRDDLSPVLQNFSLKVKKGEVIALVGASGGGKSTVLSLIPRFFDAQQGEVLIDGVPVRDLTLHSLREQIALVTQDVFLFHDSVRANIQAGQSTLADEQIRAAAQAAQAWPYIEKLTQGLDTVIGDRGQKLSGGERQRLSIARALLKDAPILLLDEATSALDSENERLVQAALDRLMVGRTAIVVAHRLSTIRKANRILVLERGQVVEEGSHDSLLAKGGAYARALSLQESFHG